MRKLTIFTPTYNRLHTINRTYKSLCQQTCQNFDWLIIDDGSTDGTREWVESLGKKIQQKGEAFDWMGRRTGKIDSNHFIINAISESNGNNIQIEYVYKPNGGLYTGYNTAIETISSELCVCIDSDDYMPNDAVKIIIDSWWTRTDEERNSLCGLVGLDYNVADGKPIGGLFSISKDITWALDLKHQGDVKYVFKTDLLKKVAPQIGFEGEKDFNPHYMQMTVLDNYQLVVLNKNICWVEYQIGTDSMSQAIFKQYVRSPNSYAKYRLNEMILKHGNSVLNKFRLNIHYVSACIFSHDKAWLKNSPIKSLTILAAPLGLVLNLYLRYKSSK